MKNDNRTSRLLGFVVGGVLVASCLLYIACDGGSNAVKEVNPAPDTGVLPDGAKIPEGGTPDGPLLPDGAPADCFMNPTTHFEIINACTNAVKIAKNPTLAGLLSDGGLPALP